MCPIGRQRVKLFKHIDLTQKRCIYFFIVNYIFTTIFNEF